MKYLIIFVLLLFGCSKKAYDEPSGMAGSANNYEIDKYKPIVIDTSFSEEEISIIVAAIDEWFVAIPSAKRSVIVGDNPNFIKGLPDNVSSGKVEDEHGATGIALGASVVYDKVYVRNGLSIEKLRSVILHETGHYLGAPAHLNTHSILASHASKWTDKINDDDIEYVCSIREDCE